MTRLYIGCYTPPAGEGQGISLVQANSLRLVTKLSSPSFLALHPQGHTLYAVSELAQGRLSAWRIQPDGGLSPLNSRSTRGDSPAHVSVDPRGRWVFAVNYAGGAALLAWPLCPDGRLGELAARRDVLPKLEVTSERQAHPHPHCARPAPDGAELLLADLGRDEIQSFSLDPATLLAPVQTLSLPAGSGPRHLSVSPDGRLVAVSLELASQVALLAREQDGLRVLDVVSSLPPGTAGENYPSEVQFSPDGHFVYLANRGHDSLTVFEVLAGGLSAVQWVPAGGPAEAGWGAQWPRHFAFTPDGSQLWVANERAGTLSLFVRDAQRGVLDWQFSVPCASPSCVCPVP